MHAEILSKTSIYDALLAAVTNPTVIAACVALLGVILSALLSARIAKGTSSNLLKTDYTKRQSELALKISELMSDPDDLKRKNARRRFAVGVIKIMKSGDNEGQGKVFFIPMNSRVTIGRDKENDIVLIDKEHFLSRWHCGFIADQRHVYIDDYISTNKTVVNLTEIDGSTKLEDGDQITLGAFTLKFQHIKENAILSQ